VVRALIVAGVIVTLALLLLILTIYLVRHYARQEDKREGRAVRGDLTGREERELIALLDDAHELLKGIGQGDPLVAPIDFLTDGTKVAVADWRRRYIHMKGKVERA